MLVELKAALCVVIAFSRDAVAGDPCDSGGCSMLWNGISQGDMSYDNHGGSVQCNAGESVSWSGNEMTLRYNGNGHTCYAKTRSLKELAGWIPNRGLVSANIKVNNEGCNPSTIWPAFWLVGTNHGAWPGCGEIDITERMYGGVHTNLIGATNGGGGVFDPRNQVQYAHYPGSALSPDGQYRKYALEWHFHDNVVDFTAWFEGNWVATHTCPVSGNVGNDLTCAINANAIRTGYHVIVFDADTRSPTKSDHYSITVRDVKIQAINHFEANSTSTSTTIKCGSHEPGEETCECDCTGSAKPDGWCKWHNDGSCCYGCCCGLIPPCHDCLGTDTGRKPSLVAASNALVNASIVV